MGLKAVKQKIILAEEYCLIFFNLSPPNILSSAIHLICFNFQSASLSLKVCENFVRVSNSLDLGETPSYSASHPDLSCLHNNGTIVVLGGLRVKLNYFKNIKIST